MDVWTGAAAIAFALCIGLWVPYYLLYVRGGRAHGHTWFTAFKPRGHSDIGPDAGGARLTKPGIDEARGARH